MARASKLTRQQLRERGYMDWSEITEMVSASVGVSQKALRTLLQGRLQRFEKPLSRRELIVRPKGGRNFMYYKQIASFLADHWGASPSFSRRQLTKAEHLEIFQRHWVLSPAELDELERIWDDPKPKRTTGAEPTPAAKAAKRTRQKASPKKGKKGAAMKASSSSAGAKVYPFPVNGQAC